MDAIGLFLRPEFDINFMRVYKLKNIPKEVKKSMGSSPASEQIKNLPSVKKERTKHPYVGISESSFQSHDKTNYYQWMIRNIYWYPVGPVFKIIK